MSTRTGTSRRGHTLPALLIGPEKQPLTACRGRLRPAFDRLTSNQISRLCYGTADSVLNTVPTGPGSDLILDN